MKERLPDDRQTGKKTDRKADGRTDKQTNRQTQIDRKRQMVQATNVKTYVCDNHKWSVRSILSLALL